MTRDRWVVLEPLLDAALDLPAASRSDFIARLEDEALAAELAQMLEQLEREDPLLDLPAAERFPALLAEGAELGAAAELRAYQEAFGAAYTLEREIGGGGMSRVFLAHESALGRRVVIKTLAPALAEGFSAERFARETRLAASLQQANIVPLLSADSAGGIPYYTMPFVEGHSLRHHLRQRGALPVGEAVGILRDVARALAYAHAHGVVHRDIKPANILLSGGTAVVTDFGIAKAFGAARTGDAATLTRDGARLGTPAFMAPEQAAGEQDVDHRADLYAFGCVAHEIFTGRPPFVGEANQVVAAHFRTAPRPVTDLRPDVPPSVADLIARCLEKDPTRRPASAEDLLRVLDGDAEEQRVRRRRMRNSMVLAGLAAAATLVPTVLHRVRPPPAATLPLVALPFANMTGDSALSFRSDGISHEILAVLGRLPGVRITGRTGAYRYGGTGAPDTHAASRALGARLLVDGAYRQAGGRSIVFAELHDSVGDRTLLADTFARDSMEFGALTREVAQAIADTLRVHFGERFARRETDGSAGGTTNDEAMDSYLQGQELLKRRGPGRIQQAVTDFEHAIALDPEFARAYAALAAALQFYPYFVGTPPGEVRDRTFYAAHHALELDSTLADAHAALGVAYAHEGSWRSSREEFRRALELEPDNVAAHFNFGRLLVARGWTEEGLSQLEQAHGLEPVSPVISTWLAYGHFLSGRRDAADLEIERALQLDSTLLPAANLGALMALSEGRNEVARRRMAVPSPVGVMTDAPYVFARLRDTVAADRLVDAMEANNPQPWFTEVELASVRLAVGDTAGALTDLERSAARSGPMWLALIPVRDPAFDPLRGSPRFAALLRAANMDVASLTAADGGRGGSLSGPS